MENFDPTVFYTLIVLIFIVLIILIFDTLLTIGLDRRSKNNTHRIDRIERAQKQHEEKENEALSRFAEKIEDQLKDLDRKGEKRFQGLEDRLFAIIMQGK